MFNENLRCFRKRHGLSQAELGYRVNVSDKTVRRWENGQAEPSVREIQKLAEVLGVTVKDLLEPPDDGKVRISVTLVEELEMSNVVNMNQNAFSLQLGSNGQIGLSGAGSFQSAEDLLAFMKRATDEMMMCFELQQKRGLIKKEEK